MGKCSDDLAKLIDAWIEEKPHRRDISMLSDLADVPYTTMRRVYQGGKPECHTALSILRIVAPREESMVYLKEHFPGAASFLEPIYQSGGENVSTARAIVRDSLTYRIMLLAYGDLVTRSDVVERYGTQGLEVAESLCALGKTQWVEDKLKVASGASFGLYENKEDVVISCHHITEWSLENAGYPMAMAGSVTYDEFMELESMTREYVTGVSQRLTKSKGGSILVAISSVFTKVFQRGGDQ